METIFIYLLKSSFWIGVFGIFYLVFLRNTTFFVFNRVFLMLGILLSLLLPFVSISYDVVLNAKIRMPSVANNNANLLEESFMHLYGYKILFVIYLIGVLSKLIFLIIDYLNLRKLIKTSTVLNKDNRKILQHHKIKTPFSFYDYILLPTDLPSNAEQAIIIQHERIHIQQKHWIDIVCGQCILIIQFFNPLAWTYVSFQKENHELQVDDLVLRSGISIPNYQATLLNQQFGYPIFPISNYFNFINPKKRFKMMKKQKTNAFRKYSLLLLLPVIGSYMWLTATPNYFIEDNAKTANHTFVVVGGKVDSLNIKELKNNMVSYSYASNGSDNDTQTINIRFNDVENVDKPLVFVNGKQLAQDKLNSIDPNTIETMNVLKDQDAVDIYGDKGKNGVIVITLKDNKKSN